MRKRRAEHRERRVTLEFVDQPVPLVHGSNHDLEEVVEHPRHLVGFMNDRQLRRADEVDEKDRHVTFIAGRRFVLIDGAASDLLADVATEQIPQPVALPKACDHPVETRLQPPDLGPLVDVDAPVDASLLDVGHRVDHLVDGVGYRHRHQDHRAQPEHDGDERQDQ